MASTLQIADEEIESFSERVREAILQPGDEDYEAARTVRNAKVQRHPALVVRCSGAADVMAVVDFGPVISSTCYRLS